MQGLSRFIGGGLFEVKEGLAVPFMDSFNGFWGCRLLLTESLNLKQGKELPSVIQCFQNSQAVYLLQNGLSRQRQ